jgi:hypothetical protein
MELSINKVNTILQWSEEKVTEYLSAIPSDFDGSIIEKKEFILDLEHASLNGSIN